MSRRDKKRSISIDIADIYRRTRFTWLRPWWLILPKSQRSAQPPPPPTPPLLAPVISAHNTSRPHATVTSPGQCRSGGGAGRRSARPIAARRPLYPHPGHSARDPFPGHRCRFGLVPRQSVARRRAITFVRPFSAREFHSVGPQSSLRSRLCARALNPFRRPCD